MSVTNTKEAQKVVGFYEGGERPKGDFYPTSEIAITKLLDAEEFTGLFLEPCCGNGAISKVLQARGHEVISRDLYDWGFGESGKDFITEPIIEVDSVVTNPPFNLSLEFTARALECTKARQGKVAMLNRIQWLEGVKRTKFFTENPLSKVLVFTRRIPRMHRFDFTGKPGISLLCFAWFIFDWKYSGEPRLGWI